MPKTITLGGVSKDCFDARRIMHGEIRQTCTTFSNIRTRMTLASRGRKDEAMPDKAFLIYEFSFCGGAQFPRLSQRNGQKKSNSYSRKMKGIPQEHVVNAIRVPMQCPGGQADIGNGF